MSLRKIIKRLGRVKVELVILPVLIFLAVIFGALLVRWPHENDIKINRFAEKIPEAALSVSVVPTISTPGAGVSAEQESEEVTLIIEKEGFKESWQVEVEGENTVEGVLTLAAVEGLLDVETTDYGGSMGVFVESLDGVVNNNIEKIYWHLYINGVLSPVGATQAVVEAGDIIIWKYEKQHDEN